MKITITLKLTLAALGLMLSGNLFATTVEFWTTETQSERMTVIETLAATFEALNPDVTVKVVPVDENDMATQIAAAAAAGTLPQLIEAGSELIMAFGEEGILNTDLSKDVLNTVGKKNFYTGALNMLRTPKGGHYYGLPYHGWIQGIWYRKDWFEQAGLKPPTDWNSILKAAETFTKPDQNQYGILVGTKVEGYSEQVFTHLALSNKAAEFNKKGELIFDSKATVETLEFYKKLAQYNPPGPQNWRARDYYLQGKMAMFFYSTYIMDDLALAEVAKGSLTADNFAELSGGKFDPNLVKNTGFVPIIHHKTDASYGVLVGLAGVDLSDDAEADATRRLVEFLYEPAPYITFLHMAPGGMNPMIKGIAENPQYLKDPNGVFELYGVDKIKEIIAGFEKIKTFSVVDGEVFPQSGEIFAKQIIPQMIYSTIFEGVSAESAVKQATQKMQQLMD
ncbi:ABC transporter substrate-binding protein [Gynuella sunshinyii]|uniref:ABC-type sugar transport system, periplasmic component n=1 Tax=Gynuella sunshinyii YC6258 TaxID=1445510 RepID=A0A0C5W2B6_9GAMM|nr:extracellular solute-binding protein [Gynuella sunshinyii]AJQ96809.1 ABC-type sugar transport system, periplasmic component [Gynuella sunshinyii YC6258]